MANVDAAFGLRPVRHISGASYNGATVKCYISANYATALFIGDGVIFTGALADKDTTAKCPSIIACTGATASLIRGVIVSFDPIPTGLQYTYRVASTERWANVCMDPDVVYQIQDDGDGTPSKVFPGQNATIGLVAGSTTTGLSGAVMCSTTATTQAHPLHIIGLADIENNELGDHAIWEVLLNTCENVTGRFLGITAV